jgi:hypothetical protein
MKKKIALAATALAALGAFAPAGAEVAANCDPQPSDASATHEHTVDETGTTVSTDGETFARAEGNSGWIEVYGQAPTDEQQGHIGVRGDDSGDDLRGDTVADRDGADACINGEDVI